MTGKPRLTPLDAVVGANAKRLRESRKIKLEQLAEKFDCGHNMLSMLENGKRAWSLYWIGLYAEFFKVHPAELLGGVSLSDEDMKTVEIIKAVRHADDKIEEHKAGLKSPSSKKPR